MKKKIESLETELWKMKHEKWKKKRLYEPYYV